MERFNSLSGWSGQNDITRQVKQEKNSVQLPTEYDITFKNMMAEVFGWSGSVMDVAGEDNPETDEANWQNNEDPEAAEHSEENTNPVSPTGDAATDDQLATNGEIGGNLAAGAGIAGGTGSSEIGGTTTGSSTGVAGVPG